VRIVVPIVAGLWLFAVGVQSVAHLALYGLAPLPNWVARLDFTPQYTLLTALVILAAVVARLGEATNE
jgi:hypothetical protein